MVDSSVAYPVKTITSMSGSTSFNAVMVSMPFMSGIKRSAIATSNCRARGLAPHLPARSPR